MTPTTGYERFSCSFKSLIEDLLESDSFISKRMFGGLAIYLHGKMMLLLSESIGDREYRDKTFDYDIWNGVLVPSRKERHEKLQGEFPSLIQHPILGSWLYLPQNSEDFESTTITLCEYILANDPQMGVIPKERKSKATKKKKKKAKLTKKK